MTMQKRDVIARGRKNGTEKNNDIKENYAAVNYDKDDNDDEGSESQNA